MHTQMHSNTHACLHTHTHRVLEAIVFVDVAGAGDQLDSVSETYTPPLSMGQIGHRDGVHFPRLAALIHHRLLTEPQPPIILQGETYISTAQREKWAGGERAIEEREKERLSRGIKRAHKTMRTVSPIHPPYRVPKSWRQSHAPWVIKKFYYSKSPFLKSLHIRTVFQKK